MLLPTVIFQGSTTGRYFLQLLAGALHEVVVFVGYEFSATIRITGFYDPLCDTNFLSTYICLYAPQSFKYSIVCRNGNTRSQALRPYRTASISPTYQVPYGTTSYRLRKTITQAYGDPTAATPYGPQYVTGSYPLRTFYDTGGTAYGTLR